MNARKPRTPAELLVDPEVKKVIERVLLANGMAWQDVEDGRQDVYVKAFLSFERTEPPPPDTLERMTAFCAEIARNHVIDALRAASVRERDLVAGCPVEELAPLGPPIPRRDPVDAGRQLEVLAQLFREGTMPEKGVDILEGVACRCSQKEMAQELGIEANLVRWRLHEMRRIYRARMEKLGLLPNVTSLTELVCVPGAIDAIRSIA